MPVRHEMTPEEFEARGIARRLKRADDALVRRVRRRALGYGAVVFGAILAVYVVAAVVWGVR